jgi:hypothetical protein
LWTAQPEFVDSRTTPVKYGLDQVLNLAKADAVDVTFDGGERAAWVKQSVDICEKKGVLGAGYIPEAYQQTVCFAKLRGAVRVLPVRRSRVRPHVPYGQRIGLGLVGHHRREGSVTDQRRGAHRDRIEQGV